MFLPVLQTKTPSSLSVDITYCKLYCIDFYYTYITQLVVFLKNFFTSGQTLHLDAMVPEGCFLCCSCCTQRVFQHNNFPMLPKAPEGKAPFFLSWDALLRGTDMC